MKISILGSGTWAMGLAGLLLDNGHNVVLWGRSNEQILSLSESGKNYKYTLPRSLKGNIKFTTNISEIKSCDFLLNAIPTQEIRNVFESIGKLNNDICIINASKGIEVKTLKFVSEISDEFFPKNDFVAISGPSHAEELAKKMPTVLVSSSVNEKRALEVQNLFFSEYCRVYTNKDIKGAEISGALKNIIALAAGVSDGLGFGDNTKAAIMTRGLHEIKKFGINLGACPETFEGLTGVGDLIVTCTSMHSRNRRCGILVGEGLGLKEASKRIGMVVEGASTVKAAIQIANNRNIDMPITKTLYDILYDDADVSNAVKSLMMREAKPEKMLHQRCNN